MHRSKSQRKLVRRQSSRNRLDGQKEYNGEKRKWLRLVEESGSNIALIDMPKPVDSADGVVKSKEAVFYQAGPILFTAPHTLRLQRDNHEDHLPEPLVLNIVKLLTVELGPSKASSIHWRHGARQYFNSNRDPNYLRTEELKTNPWHRFLLKHHQRHGPISIHFDFHGMNGKKHGSDLALGIEPLQRFLKEPSYQMFPKDLEMSLKALLAPRGFVVKQVPSMTGYRGKDRMTLSQQSVMIAKACAVQIELSMGIRESLVRDADFRRDFRMTLYECYNRYVRQQASQRNTTFARLRLQCAQRKKSIGSGAQNVRSNVIPLVESNVSENEKRVKAERLRLRKCLQARNKVSVANASSVRSNRERKSEDADYYHEIEILTPQHEIGGCNGQAEMCPLHHHCSDGRSCPDYHCCGGGCRSYERVRDRLRGKMKERKREAARRREALLNAENKNGTRTIDELMNFIEGDTKSSNTKTKKKKSKKKKKRRGKSKSKGRERSSCDVCPVVPSSSLKDETAEAKINKTVMISTINTPKRVQTLIDESKCDQRCMSFEEVAQNNFASKHSEQESKRCDTREVLKEKIRNGDLADYSELFNEDKFEDDVDDDQNEELRTFRMRLSAKDPLW
eukprot:g1242.t1